VGGGARRRPRPTPLSREARPATPHQGEAARAVRAEETPAGGMGSTRFRAVLVNRSRLQKPAVAQALAASKALRAELAGLLDGRQGKAVLVLSPEGLALLAASTTQGVRGTYGHPRNGRIRRSGGAPLAASRRSRRYELRATHLLRRQPPGVSRATRRCIGWAVTRMGRSGRSAVKRDFLRLRTQGNSNDSDRVLVG
jgi:hypothetical protein